MEKDILKKQKKLIDIIPPKKSKIGKEKKIEQKDKEETEKEIPIIHREESEKKLFYSEEAGKPEIPEETGEDLFFEPPKEIKESPVFPEGIFKAKKGKIEKKHFIMVGIVGIIVLGIVFYFTLAKAEIFLKPKTETVDFETELILDKNLGFVDLEQNKIPAQLFEVEKSEEKEFPTTQEKEIERKAKGIITVYNQYSSSPQTLVKTTRFVTEDGKTFRTTKTIVVPGAKIEEGKIIPSTIDVEVEADEPGEEYNIGPSSFTIPGFKGTPKYTGFYGRSFQPMTGGAKGKVKVATVEDIEGAKELLIAELKNEAREELIKKIPSEIKVLEDSIVVDVVEASSDVEPDQPAKKFKIKVKISAKALGFIENDAISLINSNLSSKVSEDKKLLPETINIAYTLSNLDLEKGTARLSCKVKENVAWKIDLTKIKKELAGKNEVEVRQYLTSQPEIESAKVVFWPFWVKKIPSNENKIKITID